MELQAPLPTANYHKKSSKTPVSIESRVFTAFFRIIDCRSCYERRMLFPLPIQAPMLFLN